MALHGKELTTEQKEIVLNLSNEGFSSYKIQNMTGCKASTVD
jgi:DNA-directed RNA polymerase specialized sigma24 family protein